MNHDDRLGYSVFPQRVFDGPSPEGVRELAVKAKRRAFRVIRGGR